MTVTVPALGFGIVMSGWGGGQGAALLTLAVGVPLTVGLLAIMGTPVRDVVPLCASTAGRFGWAALVFAAGSAGAAAGVLAYGEDVDLGGAGTRIALAGVPYAVAAAFFVPSRRVRVGAAAVLALGVVYGGYVGPAQAERRAHAAEIAEYREQSELLRLGSTPAGTTLSRAHLGPGSFSVAYHPARANDAGHVGLTVGRPPTPAPAPVCPEILGEGVTCDVDARGVLRMVHAFPDGGRAITLIRYDGPLELRVESQSLDERGLRRLLGSVRPMTDAELEDLMRERLIERSF
ncbi:hypothetical protein H9Y04_29225 [Streptomyces sp. TRM66268-LWL]|uniref:Uncharacterized protein n=2 Tax=Streptomyces polyasparticus TaxID=2767826 RepID=A0ABR7SQ21_9ACTN|nr:hypothetical protein [Streptomyces polyasparticus]